VIFVVFVVSILVVFVVPYLWFKDYVVSPK